nr:uncharacterized protein CTRU02_10652 [Colletotrichum truncatum]KAF6786953.1 hypothetical protein CTRU02_10652 [Colletotrichum truncatum]
MRNSEQYRTRPAAPVTSLRRPRARRLLQRLSPRQQKSHEPCHARGAPGFGPLEAFRSAGSAIGPFHFLTPADWEPIDDIGQIAYDMGAWATNAAGRAQNRRAPPGHSPRPTLLYIVLSAPILCSMLMRIPSSLKYHSWCSKPCCSKATGNTSRGAHTLAVFFLDRDQHGTVLEPTNALHLSPLEATARAFILAAQFARAMGLHLRHGVPTENSVT